MRARALLVVAFLAILSSVSAEAGVGGSQARPEMTVSQYAAMLRARCAAHYGPPCRRDVDIYYNRYLLYVHYVVTAAHSGDPQDKRTAVAMGWSAKAMKYFIVKKWPEIFG